MARNWIVVGDATSSGGRVVTCSAFTVVDGKGVARINDQAVCPLHKGVFPIVDGDPTTIIDGQPVALHGSKLACGCSVLAVQQNRVFVEPGPGSGAPMRSGDHVAHATTANAKEAVATGSGTPAGSVAAPAIGGVPGACPVKVEFKELGTQYGFDDRTVASVPWKSVEKGKTDTVSATATPPADFANVRFSSSDVVKVAIQPVAPASSPQSLTVKGVDKGESEINADCGGSTRGRFKVKTYVRKTRTVAVRLVHSKARPGYAGFTSTDVSDASITAALEKVYKQAVVGFKLTRLPAKAVDFDIDGDGKIDVNSWMSAEMARIRDACKDDSYDFNIFLVDNPSDGSTGFMQYNQRYGFVHAPGSSNAAITIAHELGHGQGLAHTPSDADNIMLPTSSATKWRLRKDQWDKLNP